MREVIEGWEIYPVCTGEVGVVTGARALCKSSGRMLIALFDSTVIEFEASDCWGEEFPIAVLTRLLELQNLQRAKQATNAAVREALAELRGKLERFKQDAEQAYESAMSDEIRAIKAGRMNGLGDAIEAIDRLAERFR